MYTAYYYRLTNYITEKRKGITDYHMYSRDIYVIHYNVFLSLLHIDIICMKGIDHVKNLKNAINSLFVGKIFE